MACFLSAPRLFYAKVHHAADLGVKDFLCTLDQRVSERRLLDAAGKGCGHRCGGGGSRTLAGNYHEARRTTEPLQFLTDDFFGRSVDREAEHLLAHAGYFDAQARSIDGPGS